MNYLIFILGGFITGIVGGLLKNYTDLKYSIILFIEVLISMSIIIIFNFALKLFRRWRE